MTKDEIANFVVIDPSYLTPVTPGVLPPDSYAMIAGSMTMKECYNNALNAVIALNANAVILGVAVINSLGFPVEHAWIEMPDGTHVDPTMQSQHGEGYVDQYTYYSLYRIEREEYLPLAKKLSRGGQAYAIDMTMLRCNPETQHLFKNEWMKNIRDQMLRKGREERDQESS